MVDYIGRALVADALEEWRRQLSAGAAPSPLRDLSGCEDDVVDVKTAHPGGLAQFFAERPTTVSSLFRESDARERVLRIMRAACDRADATLRATGIATGALVVGTVAWTELGQRREMPVLVRPVTLETIRDGDVQVALHHAVRLNPVLAADVRSRAPGVDLEPLALATIEGAQFDPRPVWEAIRGMGEQFGGEVDVEERLLLGTFDDAEQRLIDDLDGCAHLISSNIVLAAVAGDRAASETLGSPLPAAVPGDRDPFAERGLGDLDDVQFAVVDVVAGGRSVYVETPPGADAASTAAAIAADGAASGRPVVVVAGTRNSAEAVVATLETAGAGDLVVSGLGDEWNVDARTRLLQSMTAPPVEVDEGEARGAGERVLAARAALAERIGELHRVHAPWGVSAYRAVQEIVRLTSGDDPPATSVRLVPEAAAYTSTHGIPIVAEAAAREYMARVEAHTQGALFPERDVAGARAAARDYAARVEASAQGTLFSEGEAAGVVASPVVEPPPPAATPTAEPAEAEPARRWWEGSILDAALGEQLDRELAVFVVRTLPRARAAAAEAASTIGVDESVSLASWFDQVRMLDEVRQTLESFTPEVFRSPLSDLIAATAPEDSATAATIAKRDKKAARRHAESLLRPGRSRAALYDGLISAHHRALWWRAHCSSGAWPAVPDEIDSYIQRADEAAAEWSRIASAVEAVVGRERLAERPWDELTATLASLTETRVPVHEEHEVRDVREALGGVGFDALFDDMAARGVAPERAAVEIEFAWWASAFEAIVAASPRLAEHGAIDAAVEEFLARDREFAATRVRPLLRAAGRRRADVIADRPDDARDAFARLMEGDEGGPVRDLWARYPELAGALRPVVVCTVDQVSEILPDVRAFACVVLLGVEGCAFAEIVPAVARGSNLAVFADSRIATRGAVPTLRDALPSLTLRSLPQPRDPRLTAALAAAGYGKALDALPAAGGGGRLDAVRVEAVGTAVADAPGVSTTPPEVTAAVVAADAALGRRDEVAIVCGNDAHADEVRAALGARPVSGGIRVATMGQTLGLSVDAVVLSLGFGADTRGEFPERLGILSSSVGAQALRQAIVAARRDLAVITALTPEYLDWAGRHGSPGNGIGLLSDLFARAGTEPEPVRERDGDWLLADLARRLRGVGLDAIQRYALGGEAIPLVVARAGEEYSIAVVTDEDPPPPGLTLRDAVRYQRARLGALGWIVVPLYTLDVFIDPDAAAERVRRALDDGLVPVDSEDVADVADVADARVPADDDGSLIPDRSADDTDVGWGDGSSDRDAEIRGDKPPHW